MKCSGRATQKSSCLAEIDLRVMGCRTKSEIAIASARRVVVLPATASQSLSLSCLNAVLAFMTMTLD